MTILNQDNFDSDTVGQLPAGWTSVMGTWAVGTVNPVSMPNSLGSTSQNDLDKLVYNGKAATLTCGIQFTQKIVDTPINSSTPIGAVGALVRYDPSAHNGYLILVSQTTGADGTVNLLVFREQGAGNYSLLGQGTTTATFSQGDTMCIRAGINNTTITAYAWKNGGAVPSTPTVSVNDGAIGAAAYSGLIQGGTSSRAADDVTIDDVGGPPASGPTTVSVNLPSALVVESPYNWDHLAVGDYGVSQTAVQATACGAYLRASFSGSTTFGAQLDTSMYGSIPTGSLLMTARIDGGALPDVTLPVQQSTALHTFFTGLSTAAHTVEMWLSGSTEATGTRWGTSSSTSPTSCIRVQSLVIDGGGSFAQANSLTDVVYFGGDSITEGVRAAGTTTQPQDHGKSYQWFIGEAMKVERGVIGYGATGWTVSGSGGMPPFPTYWNQHSVGRPRNFTKKPKAVFVMHSQNDGNISGVTTAAQAWLAAARAAFPQAWLFLTPPPSGIGDSQLKAAISAYRSANPGDLMVAYLDYRALCKTGGFTGVVSSTATAQSVDGVHPLQVENGRFGAAIAKLALQYLNKTRWAGVGGNWT